MRTLLMVALALAVAAAGVAFAAKPMVRMQTQPQEPQVGFVGQPAVANAGESVIDLIMSHPNWERNNVKVPGVFKADKVMARIDVVDGDFAFNVTARPAELVSTFTVDTARKFYVLGPVTAMKDKDDDLPTYKCQIEFAGRAPGSSHLYDAKIMDYKGTWLLYLTEPGASDWTEEWIMR